MTQLGHADSWHVVVVVGGERVATVARVLCILDHKAAPLGNGQSPHSSDEFRGLARKHWAENHLNFPPRLNVRPTPVHDSMLTEIVRNST